MDFGAMFQTWIGVLTRPGEETFQSEAQKPNATVVTALIWVVIATVIAGLLGFVRSLIFAPSASAIQSAIQQADLPPEVAAQLSTIFSGGGVGAVVGAGVGGLLGLVFAPVFFLIGVAVLHLVARLLGGEGDFGNYSYLLATFQAPITIITALLQFIPILGGCLAPILSIYSLVLAYFATKVAYSLTSGKAIAVVLIPLLFFTFLAICLAFVIAAALIPIFSN
ncbi:MAG: hypothetical protein HC802_20650 [Caldilineaceae bacterium]|nr:hypothetical protein [Caldilineaceae bacterium]